MAKDKHLASILIVDDDEAMRVMLADFIAAMGLDVTSARNGAEALRILAGRQGNFDIILTDLMMPDYTGLDILRAARKLNEEALVAIMTGYASLETAIEAIRCGAYDYLTKPFTLGEIEILVRNMIERVVLFKEREILTQKLKDLTEKISALQQERIQLGAVCREIRAELKALGSKLDAIYDLLKPALKEPFSGLV